MRRFLALVALCTFAFCLYSILIIPLEGNLLFKYLYSATDKVATYEAVALLVSVFILVLLAGTKAKIIHEEKSLEKMQKRLSKDIRWVEQRENRLKGALVIKGELELLEPRIEALLSASVGLPVTLRRIDDLLSSTRVKLKGFDSLADGRDIAETIEAQMVDVRTVHARIVSLETNFASVPRTNEQVVEFERRIQVLKDAESGVLEQVNNLRDTLDNLLADDGDISDLEAGDNSLDGDLDDQITRLSDDASEVRDRLEAVDRIVAKLPEVRQTLAEAAKAPA